VLYFLHKTKTFLKEMSKIWKIYRKATQKQRFSIWLQWAGLKEKPHQVSGFEWCKSCEMADEHRGGILADEMGLGKTIVMIGNIFCNPVRRTLIVLPNSLMGQWDSCITQYMLKVTYRWLMTKEYCIYHGANKPSLEDLVKKRIVITTYGTLAARKDILKEIEWDRIVYDEAHHLRETKTKIFAAALTLKTRINWFMTGTPIQNRKGDLYALCILLGFKGPEYRSREGLATILATRMLRRTKQSIGLRLPAVKIYQKRVPWKGEEEEALSAAIHAMTHFGSGGGQLGRPLGIQTLAAFIRSRQMCVCPKTIQESLEKEGTRNFLEGLDPLWDKITSSKIDHVVGKLLSRGGNGRRKLVFCHYRREIDEIAQRLRDKNIAVGVIDGRTSKKDRKDLLCPLITKDLWNTLLPAFHTTCGIPIYAKVTDYLKPEVLVVQIQTAAEGLNMQDFCEVYFTSPHWNPALEDQAIARCHRIGQKRPVKVFRFIMQSFGESEDDMKTLDEYCSWVQEQKRDISKDILH